MSEYAFSSPVEPQFLAATLSRSEGDVHVSLFVAKETFKHFQETSQRTLVLLDIVETVPMEQKMVTVDADAMAKSIAAQGTIALYGIYFDTGKTDLKPESAPTLDEIAKLLRDDAGLKLYVVGHTDGVGGFDYNMELSRQCERVMTKIITVADHENEPSNTRRRACENFAGKLEQSNGRGRELA